MSQVKYCIQVCCVALAIIFASILAEPVNIALSWTFGVRCVFCSPAWAIVSPRQPDRVDSHRSVVTVFDSASTFLHDTL
jgi:hypothetical protein